MNVRICQKKCTEKNNCKEYIAHSETAIETENITLPAEEQAVALGAAWILSLRGLSETPLAENGYSWSEAPPLPGPGLRSRHDGGW